MNGDVRAKEPWLAVFFNMLFLGLGQAYAKRIVRAITIIGIDFVSICVVFIGVFVLVTPGIIFTKALFIIGIIFVIAGTMFQLFVFVDGWMCVRKYNVTNNVKPVHLFIRTLAIIGCLILFFTGGIRISLALYIRHSVAQAFKIPGDGMAPTLQIGDRIMVNKKAYLRAGPQRGDVIVFNDPRDMKKIFIKRVAGLPGETLEIKDGKVIINGNVMESEFHYYNAGDYAKNDHVIKVPFGNYFVLGDNSIASLDSRFFGFVPIKSINGRAMTIYWPFERLGTIE